MVKITKIKSQKNKKRVSIYFDGKFAFSLDADNFLKAGLKVGQKLSAKEVKNLIFKNEFHKLLDKTLRFISFRPRSEKEIVDYLRKKKIVPKLIEEIVKKLRSLGQIDDQVFAAWWLEQRANFRPRGKMGLRMELRRKGISEEIINGVLENLDELPLARKAMAKKIKEEKRIAAFLSRRGFSWETIKIVLDGVKDS